MLREIPSVRQIPGEARRRWFHDERMDLFVWFEGEAIVGFQLSYDKPEREHSLTWRVESGYKHSAIDEGSRPGRYPGSPILVADGAFDGERVAVEFAECAAELEASIKGFVLERLLRVRF